jgi:hypothetical protein
MRDAFEERGDDLRGYLGSFPLADRQHGLLVLRGREVAGSISSRGRRRTRASLKLLQSYALEALTDSNGKEARSGRPRLSTWRVRSSSAPPPRRSQLQEPRHGWDVSLRGAGRPRFALMVGEDDGGRHGGPHDGAGPQIAVHGAFFRLDETDGRDRADDSSLAGYARRRGYRGWGI